MNFAEVFTQDFLLTFDGRINRARYWAFFIVYIVLAVIAGFIDGLIHSKYGVVGGLLALVMLYPSICVSIKRWHDRDKSGWWVLIALIPIIGAIWVLVECGILRGTEGQNRYGPDPLAGS